MNIKMRYTKQQKWTKRVKDDTESEDVNDDEEDGGGSEEAKRPTVFKDWKYSERSTVYLKLSPM